MTTELSNFANRMVIWNPQASRAQVAEPVRGEMERDGRYSVHATSSPDEAAQLARMAREGETELVVAAGGDGTANTVINALCDGGRSNESTTLAILPIGTANDLCRSLRIPLDPSEALRLFDQSPRRRIDVARLQAPQVDRLFANLASGGNSNRVSQALTDEIKQRWGAWSYLRGAIEVLQDLDGYTIQLVCDDGPSETLSAWNFIVANGATVGGFEVAPSADPTDGLLDLIVIQDGTALDVASMAAGVLVKNYLDHESVVHRRVKKVVIETVPDTPTTADGEPVVGQPLTISVVPGALNVVVGPEFRVS